MALAALAKAAAKKAAKGAAKKSGIRRTGDAAYNARRQYYRSAERYLKKAEGSTGAAATRYRQLAKQDFENALGTYEPGTTQKLNKPMQRLADEFGVDVSERRARTMSEQEKATAMQKRQRLIDTSSQKLEKNLKNEETRRERESRALLNNDEIGSRILGGTVDIWTDKATVRVTDENGEVSNKVDNTKILPALYDYFKVNNLSDLIGKIEDIAGSSLYSTSEDYNIYEDVKITIQKHVKANNKLVA